MVPVRTSVSAPADLAASRIWHAWWPLAVSWLLMGVELPLIAAVMARLPEPSLSLAAYGGIVFPLSFLIEAPVVMLLSTSTALSRDLASYRIIRRFSHALGASLSALHALVAFTPLYDLVVRHVLDAPEAIVEPGRIGLRLMTPWTWAIASRRFQQGVLIRFGHSREVGVGTGIRLLSGAAVLAVGYALGTIPGIAVGTAAVATAVVCEAAFVAWRVRPVLAEKLSRQPAAARPLGILDLVRFHTPLALTQLLHLAAFPIGSAAMGRMPETIASLAAWPVVSGLVFLFRSVSFAYTEVVVVLLDEPGSFATLRRFAGRLAAATTFGLLLVAATPIGPIWFEGISALEPHLAVLAGSALWLALAMPALAATQAWHQGVLVHARRTRAISEAVGVALAVQAATLGVGVAVGGRTGIYIVIAAATAGGLAQSGWLAARARGATA